MNKIRQPAWMFRHDRNLHILVLATSVLQLLDVLTRSEADRAALIGRLSHKADAEWLAELLIDLEQDEPARLHLVDAPRRIP
jgi:hypothetical protein